MYCKRQVDAVAVWAPAKVNLYLEVLAKRADGYHEIETLMVAISLYDTLEFKEEISGEIRLHCDCLDLTTGPDNLVIRAAELLRLRTGCQRGADIKLGKKIPLAAGLAGGSADAAATLVGLNDLWNLRLSRNELAGIGAEIGSDVAFFFAVPAAWCTGRGERVAPVSLRRPLWLVLLCPRFGLATADVYRGVSVPEHPLSGKAIVQAVQEGDMVEIGRRLHNRLQPVAERLCPAVANLRRRLASFGPAGQTMSGSGASVFALGRDYREALHIARGLRDGAKEAMDPSVFLVRSCV
jgi:4-diphosphocytidyl-2-C-methyl-D-erythritol kinase